LPDVMVEFRAADDRGLRVWVAGSVEGGGLGAGVEEEVNVVAVGATRIGNIIPILAVGLTSPVFHQDDGPITGVGEVVASGAEDRVLRIGCPLRGPGNALRG